MDQEMGDKIFKGKCGSVYSVDDDRIYFILHSQHRLSIACKDCINSLEEAVKELLNRLLK
ncbi:hypothetical protein HY498_05095 [Candidatus Woesearchaeota archaeon]|nr:hypothetical protein [Candidatus Woesearchaeota archaeon]